MRTILLLSIACLAATILAAPGASAWATCNAADPPCPGLYCLGQGSHIGSREDCNVVFVPDPRDPTTQQPTCFWEPGFAALVYTATGGIVHLHDGSPICTVHVHRPTA